MAGARSGCVALASREKEHGTRGYDRTLQALEALPALGVALAKRRARRWPPARSEQGRWLPHFLPHGSREYRKPQRTRASSRACGILENRFRGFSSDEGSNPCPSVFSGVFGDVPAWHGKSAAVSGQQAAFRRVNERQRLSMRAGRVLQFGFSFPSHSPQRGCGPPSERWPAARAHAERVERRTDATDHPCHERLERCARICHLSWPLPVAHQEMSENCQTPDRPPLISSPYGLHR